MKHQIVCILAAGAAVLLGTAACNKAKEKEFNPDDPAIMTIAAQPEVQIVQAEGGDLTFTFDAPDYWFVSSPADWIAFEPKSGKPGPVTLTVTARQNVSAARSALVTVTTKYERGKFSIDQQAWPYTGDWTISGSIGGGQEIALEDAGDRLAWKGSRVSFHAGETFRFHMGGAVSLGLGGELVPVEGQKNTYAGSLVKEGAEIALPFDGFWDVTMDLNTWTVTAVLAQRFAWTYIGTVNGSDGSEDFQMADMGEQLVWEATRVPYHSGELFRFRMDRSDVVNMGIDGAFAPVEGAGNTFVASLRQDGDPIALPAEGYWTLTLNLNTSTLTAVLTEEFPRVHAGVIWEDEVPESHGAVSWSSTYRFGLDGKDEKKECLATLPEVVWNKLKTEPFYLVVKAENPQIRVTTGWWSTQWGVDFQPGNELLADNGDGTWTLRIDLSGDPDFVSHLDVEHILFTGDRYTPLGLYPESAWVNEGAGAISWSSQYRFGLEGHDEKGECLTVFPETVWNKVKTETFYLDLEATDPQIRVTTGWWSTTWTGDDIYNGNGRLTDNGDGTFTLAVNLAGDSILDLLDVQHLLFTGDRYTPLRIRFQW